MSWRDKKIKGVVYSLAHLAGFDMPIVGRDGTVHGIARVSFGLHTFTREWLATDPLDHKMVLGTEVRCFCPIRYQLSLDLPAIIQAACGGNAHFCKGRNYLLVHQVGAGPYAIFFDVEKARQKGVDVMVFVDSAYTKPGLPRNLPVIGFAKLLEKTAKGLPVTRPKK